jgi:hypothetical protein
VRFALSGCQLLEAVEPNHEIVAFRALWQIVGGSDRVHVWTSLVEVVNDHST